MSSHHAETVSTLQIGDAIQKCADAHPEFALRQRLHPDAELLCEVLADMNYRHLAIVERDALQNEHLAALMRWVG